MTASPLDDTLLELVLAAQNHPVGSLERRRTLGQLIRVLRNSNKLVKPMRGHFQGFYSDVYEEALQRLFFFVFEKIDSYNPERGKVLQWVNFFLGQRFFIEASREFMPTVYKGMDAKSIKKVTLDDLDRKVVPGVQDSSNPSLLEALQDYINSDPDQVFEAAHIDGHPKANLKQIALMRLQGYSWRELSDQFDIPPTSLSSFYQRGIKKFAPIIRKDLL